MKINLKVELDSTSTICIDDKSILRSDAISFKKL
jgi:hypothetical protein